jgi:heavy metal translocating P-type ATPase
MLPVILAAGGAFFAGDRWARSNRQQSRVEQWFKDLYDEVHDTVQELYEEVTEQAPVTLAALDDQYQQFMVEKFDPFFGRTRSEQLAEIVTSDETLVITDYERQLNRYIAAAVATMGTAIVGVYYPPVLIVTLGTALYSTTLIFRNGYNAIVHERKLRMDVMGSLYFIGTYAGGFFIPGAFGLIAYYMSEKLVFITQDRSQKSLIKVFGQQPRTVWQIVDGVEVEVLFESVQAGDTIVVQAGQMVPVDGAIIHGIATIDQHILTGEAQPAEKGVGDQVLTATLMMAGKMHVQVEKTGEETAAAQIGVMLNNTASYQAGIVSKGEQVADKSVPPTMLLALLALPFSGYRYMVTILGSAIGLNIKITAPIAMLNFLNVAANHGILVKDGRSLELLKEVDTVVFDKTGTLTLEQPHIAHIHTCADVDADTLLMYAAAAEHRQTHPIARAILAEAAQRGLTLPEIDHAHYEMGYGLSVLLGDHLIRVGSDRYMALEKIKLPASMQALGQAGQEQGHSLVMVAVDDRLVGALELQPILRPEAKAIVQELRKRNLDIYIISGDQEQPTRRMAQALDIPHYFANTLPENKAILVEQLQAEGRAVCFVGDGINDSIALKKANVSVSLRGASTAATDTAQIVLMAQSLQQLPFVFDLAQEFDTNMKAGFTAAVGQGVIVIGGALLAVVGIFTGTLIWEVGLLAGLGVALLPLRRHQIKGESNAQIAPPPQEQADVQSDSAVVGAPANPALTEGLLAA